MPRFFAPLDPARWSSPPHPWSVGDSALREDLLTANRLRLWLARWRRTVDEEMRGVIVDTPYGDLIVVPCQMPAAQNERWDIPTGMWCRSHNRTVYYCDELNRLWCDGGPPEFLYHVFRISAIPTDEPSPADKNDN
jgi:hypothetical protein